MSHSLTRTPLTLHLCPCLRLAPCSMLQSQEPAGVGCLLLLVSCLLGGCGSVAFGILVLRLTGLRKYGPSELSFVFQLFGFLISQDSFSFLVLYSRSGAELKSQ